MLADQEPFPGQGQDQGLYLLPKVDSWLSFSHSDFTSGSPEALRTFFPTLVCIICTLNLNKVLRG